MIEPTARKPARARLPTDKLEIVVASDASTDRTDSSSSLPPRRSACQPPARSARGQGRGPGPRCAGDQGEILAFSDANTLWRPDASASSSATSPTRPSPTSAAATSTSRRRARTAKASTPGSKDGCVRPNRNSDPSPAGVGPIYAVRRGDYVELDPRFGHDLALPYLWSAAGAAQSSTRRRQRGRSRRATSRTSTGGRDGCSSTAG